MGMRQCLEHKEGTDVGNKLFYKLRKFYVKHLCTCVDDCSLLNVSFAFQCLERSCFFSLFRVIITKNILDVNDDNDKVKGVVDDLEPMFLQTKR